MALHGSNPGSVQPQSGGLETKPHDGGILQHAQNRASPENQLFSSRAQARREIFEYIELYYNNRRLHSALGYQSPREYETDFERVIDIETKVSILQASGCGLFS
jgi:hypothetical protein